MFSQVHAFFNKKEYSHLQLNIKCKNIFLGCLYFHNPPPHLRIYVIVSILTLRRAAALLRGGTLFKMHRVWSKNLVHGQGLVHGGHVPAGRGGHSLPDRYVPDRIIFRALRPSSGRIHPHALKNAFANDQGCFFSQVEGTPP